MADYLLQEGGQLDGLILVRLRQVDVLQIQHLPRALLRPEYFSGAGVGLHADLVELLDDVVGVGLRVAVHRREVNLGGLPELHEGLADQHALAAALAADNDEVLVALHPILEHGEVALDRSCLQDCSLLRADLLEREFGGEGGVGSEYFSLRVEDERLFGGDGAAFVELLEDPADDGALVSAVIGSEALDAGNDELMLRLYPVHLGKHLADLPDQRALNDLLIAQQGLNAQHPEVVLKMGGLLEPLFDESCDVDVLVVEVDHAHPRDSGRRGIQQGVCLEDEAGAVGEVDALSGGEGEKVVVVQHAVQRFHPLRVDVSV